jgi:hypothetical protein
MEGQPQISWEKLDEIIHAIKNERTILSGATVIAKKSVEILAALDNRMKEELEKLDIIINNSGKNE